MIDSPELVDSSSVSSLYGDTAIVRLQRRRPTTSKQANSVSRSEKGRSRREERLV